MNRLPPELLCLIVTYVDHTDLAPLRRVNKAFAAAAASHLFEVIPLWISIRSLERLIHISEDRQLSKYPRQIIFSPTRFIDHGVNTYYLDTVKYWLEHKPISLNSHTLTIYKHSLGYGNYIEGQRLLSRYDTDVKVLTSAFSLLPNLKMLNFDYMDTMIGSEDLVHTFGVFKAEYLLSLDCQYTLPALMQVLAMSSVKIKVFHLGRDEYPEASILDSFVDYASASSLTRPRRLELTPRPLRQNLRDDLSNASRDGDLRDNHSYPAMISSHAWSNTFCDANAKTCTDALSDLRELKVGEINLTREDAASVLRVVAALRSLLTFAPYLETVTLNKIDSNFILSPGPAMDSVIPWHGLTLVKKLSLSHYQTTIVFLSDFFRRHGQTIVHVRFAFVAITGGDWSAALALLRTLPFLRLETFVLSYCDDEEYNLPVQDYILRKTDDDPLVAERERQ